MKKLENRQVVVVYQSLSPTFQLKIFEANHAKTLAPLKQRISMFHQWRKVDIDFEKATDEHVKIYLNEYFSST